MSAQERDRRIRTLMAQDGLSQAEAARIVDGRGNGRAQLLSAQLSGLEATAAGLQAVNGLSVPDAFIWYSRHGYAAYPASPTAKMLTLPAGYTFDDLGVLGEEHLAYAHQAWQQRPDMRVALIMGKASGLVAIDVDDMAEWEAFQAEHGDLLPGTAVQTTGREGGGLHHLYRRGDIDPGLLKQGSWPGFPHIELKTKGLIIAAPSLHASGARYQWQPGAGEPVPVSAALLASYQDGQRQVRAQVRKLAQQIGMDNRPAVDAGNAADFADVLCGQLGAGCYTGVYQRDNKLVTVPRFGEAGYIPVKDSDKHPEKNPPAQVRVLNQHLLQGFIASRAWTFRWTGDPPDREQVHILPPLSACSAAIHADPSRWKSAPSLAGVIHVPLLRRDGSLLAEPGYDPATSLLYLPLPGQAAPQPPTQPSEEDLKAARKILEGLLCEFRWVSKGDFLNYLAALIVPSLRLVVPPPWPPLIVNAHDRGSGKTLLSEIPRILYGGVLYAAPEGDEQELRKLITTILRATTGGVVVLDNAMKTVRSKNLASLFTDPSGMWHDRILGGNESPGLPNDRLWIINGNNIRLGGDLPRRAVWSSIDPGVPQPWLRTGFAIADLAGHVRAKRAQILAAILVLGRHWALEGRPTGSAARGDSFAPFAAALSGVLETCGLAQPGEFWSEQTNRAADGADDEDWAGFLAAVHAKWGSRSWEAGDLIKACRNGTDGNGRWQAAEFSPGVLPGNLAERIDRGHEDASLAKSLGWWLRNHEGQWTSGRHAVCCVGGGKQNRPKVWAVQYKP